MGINVRYHGRPPVLYAVDDEDMQMLYADTGLFLELERQTCFECERCAGCIGETDCGHAPCTCPLKEEG